MSVLPAALLHNAESLAAKPACRHKRRGIWQTWTWKQLAGEVAALALGLEGLAIGVGDSVAVMGDPRPELSWTIIAAQSIGAVPVPTAADVPDEEVQHILRSSQATVAVVRGQEEAERLLALAGSLPCLARIVCVDPRGMREASDPRLVSYDSVRGHGAQATLADLARRVRRLQPRHPAIILYTAGVLSLPKGVLLNHTSLLAAGRAGIELYGLTAGEEVLAALPDASGPAFLFGHVQSLLAGFPLSFPESADTVLQDLREIGPTYLFGPPVLFKRLHARIYARMAPAGPLRLRLFDRSIAALREVRVAAPAHGRSARLSDRITAAVAMPMVAWPLMDILGLSRVRRALVFGDRLPDTVAADFEALGMRLYNVYSPTEGACLVAAEPPSVGERRSAGDGASVGKPVGGTQIRVTNDGEIQFRSPAAFQAYVNGALRDADEWIATGDTGQFDAAGNLRVLGRLAHLTTLPGNRCVSTTDIEARLCGFPHVRDAVVIGLARLEDLSALISLDAEAVGAWAERQRLGHSGLRDLAASAEVRALIEGFVVAVNAELAAEQVRLRIRRFVVLPDSFDLARGELTRDRKVRRGAVLAGRRESLDTLHGLAISASPVPRCPTGGHIAVERPGVPGTVAPPPRLVEGTSELGSA